MPPRLILTLAALALAGLLGADIVILAMGWPDIPQRIHSALIGLFVVMACWGVYRNGAGYHSGLDLGRRVARHVARQAPQAEPAATRQARPDTQPTLRAPADRPAGVPVVTPLDRQVAVPVVVAGQRRPDPEA
jgi:hypothetical protein